MDRVFVRTLANGRVDLGDGTLLSAQGRVVAKGAPPLLDGLASELAQGSPTWDSTTVIDASVTDDFPAPIFDRSGNAWVVALDAAGDAVTAVESNGVTGTWQPAQVIMGPDLELAGRPALSIDGDGVVRVVCRNISASQYQILYTSHAPGGDWQTPEVIYSSSYFFQNLAIANDAAGDAIVVFDRDSSQTGLPQGWSIAYSRANGSFGRAQTISAPGQSFFVPTLTASPNGATVLLVYASSLGAGLFYEVFDAGTLTWPAAQSIPNTEQAAFQDIGVGARFPSTVDNLGNATMIAPYYTLPKGTDYKLEGLRYENGSWAHQTTLLPWASQTDQGDILDSGSMAQDQKGDSLAVGTAYTATAQNVNAFRYTRGAGWDVEVVVSQSHNYSNSQVSIAYFGASGEAVASYFTGSALKTTMYIGGAWSYSPVVTGPFTFGQDALATAPTGAVLITPLSRSEYPEAAFLRR